MTPLIEQQRANLARERWSLLKTPLEYVYQPTDAAAAVAVGLADEL